MLRKKVVGSVLVAVLMAASTTALVLAGVAADAPVADAAMEGDIETVRALLAEEADVNAAQGDGMTALHWSAFRDDLEMAELLLQAEADVAAKTRVGAIMPISMAAQNGSAVMLEKLIEAGAEANSRTSTGATALMMATMSGSVEAVEILLDNGAFVNKREKKNGQTPLMFAAWQNRPDVIRLLVERGAHIGLATYLISMDDTPLDTVGLPIQQGRRGRGPRAPGGNSTMGGQTALLFAARDGHLEAVKALVEAGADVDQINVGEGTSPMVIAVANGHYTVAKYLLDQGADPNITNIDGLAPLYATVNMRHAPVSWAPNPLTGQESVDGLELIRALLERGANPDARVERKLWFSPTSHDRGWIDYSGSTPFWRAARSNDIDAMRILIEFGADPNINSYGDMTPLMVAAGIGWIGNFSQNLPDSWMVAVRYCLELGNDINAIDKDGYTALHGAAARGDDEMVNYLVGQGADVTALNKDGDSPADMAFGPSRFFIPRPETRDLLVKLGSPFQNNCRSDQCVDGKFNAEGRTPKPN